MLPVAAAAVAFGWVKLGGNRLAPGEVELTGFVEGEERIVRSEVAGRVLEVPLREGAAVQAGATLVRIDSRVAESRRKQQELAVLALEAEIEKAARTLELTTTQVHGAIRIAEAELARAQADVELARMNFERAKSLVKSGTTPQQALDDAESRARQAEATLSRQQEALLLAKDREGEVAVARAAHAALVAKVPVEKETLRQLEIELDKHTVRAETAGTVQARLIRTGELARPSTALISILDEEDKFVRIYIPVPDLEYVHEGTRVTVELDQLPGKLYEGTVEWIATQASFTPAKIYTRDDRIQQVYEGRVRLEPAAAKLMKAGAEANVRRTASAPAAPATPSK